MGVRKSEEQKLNELAAKYPYLDFSKSKYTGCLDFIVAVCPTHGEISKKASHWNVNGCPKCGMDRMKLPNKGKISGLLKVASAKLEKAKTAWEKFAIENSEWLDTSMAKYEGTRKKIEVRCKIHDLTYKTYPRALTNQGSGCYLCGIEKIKLRAHTEEQNLVKARFVHGDRYTYISIPGRIHEKAVILCKVHGKFEQSFHNHVQGMGCPACANTCSKGESELFDFVLSLGVEAEKRNRKIIPPYELDVFIPSRNIAIEYHGLHWHADDMGGTSLKTKWQLCQEKGIRLIQIFEDEWLTRRHVVEDLLRASLGLREVKNARTLTTKIITKEEAKSFLEQWHIAGYARSELHFALCDEENIVSVLTTAKPRFGNEDLEIVRFASSCHVRGGFRKLFSLALETTNPQSVVSFADLRFGTGNTYADAGFNDMGITQADYWWFKGQERLTRYKTQKHRLKVDKRFSEFYKDDLTEREICTAAGYRKITGIGHRKFIWNRS